MNSHLYLSQKSNSSRKHFITSSLALMCCLEQVTMGWLSGYMVYGDVNRNTAFETLPDLYFPIHINQGNNSEYFQLYFKCISFKKCHYYRERTIMQASVVIVLSFLCMGILWECLEIVGF